MINSDSIKLDSLNTCGDVSKIKDGDLLVVQRKCDERNLLVQVKEVLYRGTGKEEVILSRGKNDYFYLVNVSKWNRLGVACMAFA